MCVMCVLYVRFCMFVVVCLCLPRCKCVCGCEECVCYLEGNRENKDKKDEVRKQNKVVGRKR